MASRNVIMLLFYDGEIKFEGSKLLYEGGSKRPIRIPSSSNLDELMAIIYKITKYDPLEFQIKLTYEFPGQHSVPIDVIDDDVCSVMLEQCVDKSLSLFVKKEAVSPLLSRSIAMVHGLYSSDTAHMVTMQDQHQFARPKAGLTLQPRSHLRQMRHWEVNDPRVSAYLHTAGFGDVRQLRWVRLDSPLITVLVERWHPETNTFHLPLGEITITLQDVAILLGLRVNGDAVVAPPCVPSERWPTWHALCMDLLGQAPQEPYHMGQSGTCLQLSWLRETFGTQAPHMSGKDDPAVRFHVRAYIMYLLGSVLLPDTSGNEVHMQYLPLLDRFEDCGRLSWGSAVLAFLYRQLTRASAGNRNRLAGCVHLLQLWSWEHLYMGRPCEMPPMPTDHRGPLGCRWNNLRKRISPPESVVFYRNQIEFQDDNQVVWEPYIQSILELLPPICLDKPNIWLAQVPMLCFSVMEMHVPYRVLRQFGRPQLEPPSMEEYKRIDGRGRANINWVDEYENYKERWDRREEYVIKPEILGLEVNMSLETYLLRHRPRSLTSLVQQRAYSPTQYYPKGSVQRDLMDGHMGIRALLLHGSPETFFTLRSHILELQDDMCRRLQLHLHKGSTDTVLPNLKLTPPPPSISALSTSEVSTPSPVTHEQPLRGQQDVPAPEPVGPTQTDELPSRSGKRLRARKRQKCNI